MGQIDLAKMVAPVVSQVLKEQLPSIQGAALKTLEAAEPTVRAIIREEVMPKVTLWGGLAIVSGILLGAAVGSLVATAQMRRAARARVRRWG